MAHGHSLAWEPATTTAPAKVNDHDDDPDDGHTAKSLAQAHPFILATCITDRRDTGPWIGQFRLVISETSFRRVL